jgi:hypothetical protein
MNPILENPSLVHYLKPSDAKFYLKISMTGNGDSDHQRTHFPFVIVGDTDPLAVILEAVVLSDAGTKIRSTFLLTQKDEYHLAKDEIWPVTNREIDRAWQQLFTFLNAQNQNDSIIQLKDQVGDDGKLRLWSPLFYCHHRQIFFQPPCPKCGVSLKMCRDDDLLTSLGLQPYSTSLRRYLFCPQCLEARGESDFYVRSHAKSDPSILKDQRDLTGGFGQLSRDGNRNANIPCFECDSLQQCYETDKLAMTRIVCISFYPFYMLALPAPSIHFLDLLPLLSGADVDALASRLQAGGQWGRLEYLTTFGQTTSQKTRFFFEKDEKFFLEVLYLKLSLLGELARIIFSGLNTFNYPDLGLSTDRIWASVAEQSGMLPFYWNFKLRLMGVGVGSAPGESIAKLPPYYGLYFLGSVWFYVLLVNAKQDASRVRAEVARVIEHAGSEAAGVFENILQNQPSAVFSPENVFWDPDLTAVIQGGENLWTRSLDLGFLLLQRSMSAKSQWSETEFWPKFDKLRDSIKETLFGSEAAFVSPSQADENRAIHDILAKITTKWRGDVLTRPAVPVEGAGDRSAEILEVSRPNVGLSEDLLTKETVILSPENFREEESTTASTADQLEETVLLKPEDVEQPEASVPASKIKKDLPETVILTHDGDAKAKETSPSEPPQGDIPETVIISPQSPPASPFDSDQKRSAEDDSPEPKKQGLSKKDKRQRSEKKPAHMKENDNELPETVIIDSKKPKNGQ